MPGEVAAASSNVGSVTPKSLKSRNVSTASSSYMAKLADGCAKEFIWGCELTKDKKETTWTFEEEEDDQDFLVHTLFLRHVVLGTGATKDERNVVEIETKDFSGETLKMPIAVVWRGQDMCQLDLNFSHEIPVTFRLAEGSGPVYISAQHLVEFPQELNDSEYTATETDFTDASDEEVSPVKGKKRKAESLGAAKKKKGKLESEKKVDEEDEEEEDDLDEEDEEEEEEEEEESMEDDEEYGSEDEEESSPEKQPAKKGKKGKSAPEVKASKKEKPPPVVAKGKKGKRGKSK